jgi:hypothetical protein
MCLGEIPPSEFEKNKEKEAATQEVAAGISCVLEGTQ